MFETLVAAIQQLKTDYFYHRGMMNHLWPNPYKECPKVNVLLYKSHRNNVLMIGHAFTEANMSLYPRRGAI